MHDTNSRVIANAAPAFASFIALRAKHSELLQREPTTEDAKKALLQDAEHFIAQVQATGVILSEDEERRASQNILNYWVSWLYRMDNVARLVTVAAYDPKLKVQIDNVSCPYPGVQPFTEQESEFFFGRQRQIDYMVGRLKEDRLLVIVGASGSGKTSLVQAGLLPALKKELPNGSKHFFFPPTVPGSDPLMNLALMTRKAKNSAGDDPKWLQLQVEGFKQHEGHLLKLIEEITENPAVIFIDQGEELYERSLHRFLSPFESMLDLDNSKKTIEPFLDNLLRVVQAPDRRHVVIIARRIDYEPHLKRLPSRVKEVFEPARVVLPALYASELFDAIQKPAELLGVRFDEGMPQDPDPSKEGLSSRPKETIVQALVKEITSEPVGLPLLQFTLTRLWEKRDANIIPDRAFREMGSCRAVLSDTAEKFYKTLNYFEQRTCRRLLTQLVTLDGELKAHIYPVRRARLYRLERQSSVDSLIERLAQQQLIRVSKSEMPADDWVELVHDSLINHWPTMSSWIDSKRWARRRSRAAGVIGLAAAIAILMLAGFFVIGWQQQKTKSRDLARLSNKQLANNRFDLAMLLGFAAYQTEVNTATRSNLHKLLYNLQFTPQPKRFLRKENFEAIDLSFSTEQDRPPRQLAAININGEIMVWELNWDRGKPPATERLLVAKSKATPPLIFSPDGKTLATASTDPNVKVILWTLASGGHQDLTAKGTNDTQASEAEQQGGLRTVALAFKSDGETLFSADGDGSVIQWDLKSPENVKSTTVYKHTIPINVLALNAKGDSLAAGDNDGEVFLLDVSGKRVKPKVIAKGHTTETVGDEAIYSVAFSSNGQLLAASQIDQAMIWQVERGELQREFCTGLSPTGLVVSFSDEDRTLLGYNADGNIFSWNVQRGVPLGARLYKPASPSRSVSFSSNGKFLALPNEDGAIVWDISSDRTIAANDQINSIAFRSGSNTLAIGEEGGITTWQAQDPDEHHQLDYSREGSEVLNLAYSSDGRILATGLNDGSINLRDSDSLQPIRTLKRKIQQDEYIQSATIANIVFDPRQDGHRLVEALNINAQTPSSEIVLWNADTGEQTRTLAANKNSTVTALAFRPDGQVLAWSSIDPENNSTVTLWDSVGQKQIGSPIQTQAPVTSLAFSSDGAVLAVGLNTGKIELWDKTYKLTGLLEGVSGVVADLAFSPDGSILACATNPRSDLEEKPRPGTIILWDVRGEQPEQLGDLLKGHGDAITSIAFSADGKMLASGSKDQGVLLWDVDVAGARNRFCEIINCRQTYDEMVQPLDKETPFQWLYRRAMRRPPLRELYQ